MTNLSKLIMALALAGLAAAPSNAQNTTLVVEQELDFKLTGYYQMSPTENSTTIFRNAGKVSLNTRDIINMLEDEVNIIFSSDARLLLVSQTGTNPAPQVIVRDRYQGEKFDTNVTQYFSARVLVSIEDTKINKNPLKTNGKGYDVIEFEMSLDQESFRIMGLGTLQVKTGKYEGEPVAIIHTGKVDVSGSGAYQISILTGVVPVALFGTVTVGNTTIKATAQ